MQSQTTERATRPWSSLVAAGLFFWGVHYCWGLNLRGNDLAGVGSAVSAALGLFMLLRALDGFAYRSAMRHMVKLAQSVQAKTRGRSRFATKSDTKQAGMHKPGGFFLGALEGRDLYHHGEGSVFVFGPPGSSKSTASVIPNLLLPHFEPTLGRRELASLVVLDLKGELVATCSRRLRQLGYEIVVLCGWPNKMSSELGIEIKDAGFNPTLPLLTAGDATKDMAEMQASLLLPGLPRQSGSSEFFRSFGRMILVWGLLCLVRLGRPEEMNLVALRRLLMQGPDEFEHLLAVTSESDAFGGALREYANKLIQTKESAGEEWSGAIDTATQALHFVDDFGELGRHFSVTDSFHFARVKDRPTCVFVVCPPDRTVTHQPAVNLTFSTAIEQIGAVRNNKPVWHIYDEFANVRLPNIRKALGLYRSQGQRFAMYAQTGLSQLRTLYGDNGIKDILAMCECIQAFSVRDFDTLKMLSDLAGHQTVREASFNVQPDLMGGHRLGSAGASNVGQALLRPEDIRTMPSSKQLIFHSNLPPILADKVSYLSRPQWRRWADPNPYYTH